MLGTQSIRTTLQLLLPVMTVGIGSNACGNPTVPESLPARLTILYNGPLGSNMTVPEPATQVSASVLRVKAAANFSQGGHRLTATASLARTGVASPSLRVVVNAKSPQGGLQILWVIIYEAEVAPIPAGSYDVSLVRVDDDRAQSRVEMRQTVSIP